MKIFKTIGKLSLLFVVVIAALMYINPNVKDAHRDIPYLNLIEEKAAVAPSEEDIIQRIILFGDAGHATMEPWQASMAKVAVRASIAPQKTAVVALGDNIYMRGYPRREEGQQNWDESQLESISFLDAQLRVAKESGAKLFFVPGNHDWYATELDGQAAHIAAYAAEHNVATRFEPYEEGQDPLPESEQLSGASLVFLDSEWTLSADEENRKRVLDRLDDELAGINSEHPDHLIVVNAHHPLETYGPHGGHLAEFRYWLIMNALYLFTDVDSGDTFNENYSGMIAQLNGVLAKYDNVIYAAGHDHNLQVLQGSPAAGPDYNIVSGAANSNKVSGVWHGDNTRFAMAQEGFVELNITAEGTYLQIFDINNDEPRAGFWLAL